jgi:predicted nucleic acid-binding protein
MTDAFLLDTCVISETSKKRPDENVIRFLKTAENFYLPAGALIELLSGITQVCAVDPRKAVTLSNWYHQLMRENLPIIETDRGVIEIMGVLAADPRLKNLREPRRNRHGVIIGKPRGGQDVHIAAAALSRRLPIATMNVEDFMYIDSLYPLPGIYNPATDVWHRKMESLTDRFPLRLEEETEGSGMNHVALLPKAP